MCTLARLSFFLVCFLTSVTAQEIRPRMPALAEDQQATALLHASLRVLMDSASALPSTLTASGTITEFGGDQAVRSHPVRVGMQGVDKFRWDEDLPEGTTATVINGHTAQSQSASKKYPLTAWEVAGKKIENFPIFLLARWLNSDSIGGKFVGQETIDGQSLYHISIIDFSQRIPAPDRWHLDQNRGQYEFYINPATSLLVRLRYYQETSDTDLFSLLPVDVVYSDFRAAGQFLFPSKLTRYIGTTKIAVLQLQLIQPDGAVSDQEFEVK